MSTARNLLILGGVAVGGYFLFKKISSSSFFSSDVTAGLPATMPAQAIAPTSPNGPAVTKGELLSTKSTIVTNKKVRGYKYAKIIRASRMPNGQVVREFKSPVNGFYTGRLLVVGKNAWAEIKPA